MARVQGHPHVRYRLHHCLPPPDLKLDQRNDPNLCHFPLQSSVRNSPLRPPGRLPAIERLQAPDSLRMGRRHRHLSLETHFLCHQPRALSSRASSTDRGLVDVVQFRVAGGLLLAEGEDVHEAGSGHVPYRCE